jgi:hypothetical protein
MLANGKQRRKCGYGMEQPFACNLRAARAVSALRVRGGLCSVYKCKAAWRCGSKVLGKGKGGVLEATKGA